MAYCSPFKDQVTRLIASICADNLGANALGGFKEGSSAYRGCRQCMVTSHALSDMVSYS